MPALITHRLFGEESIDRLPAGIVSGDDERAAFLLANQGPDPFFFRFRTPHLSTCMELARVMHRSRMSRQLAALRDGVSHLPAADAGVGRAWALGLLSHYVLDRNAHPFVYAQQWGIQEADPTLTGAGGQVHAVIESDLDVLMLQLKREGATVADYPPAGELMTNARIDKVAGALTSFVANSVYGLEVGANEYGGAVADMQLLYRAIEPAGSRCSHALARLEGLVKDYSLLEALAHRVTAETPAAAGNLSCRPWTDPFTGTERTDSFPALFERALDDYGIAAARFIESGDMEAVTGHVNYSGRVLDASEEFDREE
ncbi:MAG: zinc dependent phospholipase C family protein [Coriobacteriaceae bacterium]|nr:zinc dependent phospholipase C family protein [Coriobacteriaceae bacterium]